MKPILCLLFILTFVGCGMPMGGKKDFVRVEGVSTKQHSSTSSVFSSYVNQFEQQARSETGNKNFKVGDVPVNFGDTTDSNFDGVCKKYQDGTKEVIIKKSWWDSANLVSRRVMIFHELGHCRLGRTHDSSTVEVNGKKVKTSIMHPVIPDHSTFGMNEEGYLTELFTKSKQRLYGILGIQES